MKVIGITGTLGAGKGTIVEHLTRNKGFLHYSVRGFLTEELKRRDLPVNRDSMTELANELRARYGPAYIADKLHEKASLNNQNAIIESIRTPGEVELLREKGNFILFAVDADSEIRYRRVQARKSETDNISWEVFRENEKREMNSADPNKQNIRKCIEMADHIFYNNGSIRELQKKVDNVLVKFDLI
ncbi:MAG: AAA family ATPase [Bacteroidales bacterium]|nr:AAA family ATPase [Bacteroidales bacterium]MCF8337542.1 AAA family ATPase [Bacteroidales bacterium]